MLQHTHFVPGFPMRFINVKILIIASCFLLNIVEKTNAEQSYSFYDELRSSDDVKILASLRESDLDRGRDIQIVGTPDGNGNLTLIHGKKQYLVYQSTECFFSSLFI